MTCCVACMAKWIKGNVYIHTFRCLDCNVPILAQIDEREILMLCKLIWVKEKNPGKEFVVILDNFSLTEYSNFDKIFICIHLVPY